MHVAAATLEDVRAIAEVHVASWRVAYAGIVSASYLAGLSIDQRKSFKQLTDVIGLDTIRHATSSRSVRALMRALAAVRIHSITPRSARTNIRTAIAQQRFWRGPEP